ncbi:MAG: VWA domain-containing protein [Candidatus Electrothrix sp. AR3]|nr:VWA domain-containing protein [Candidatus Electrothrix sp. AR3]
MKIFIFVLTACCILSGCSEDSTSQKNSASQQKKTTQAPDTSKRAEPVRWPPSAEDQESIVIADTLIQKNYVLVFDGSGSMGQKGCSGNKTKSAAAKEAVSDWAQSVPADAHLGLVAFDQSGFSVRLQLGQENRQEFIQQVEAIIPGSTTPLTKSLQTAYDILTQQARSQLGYGEYHLVIVTDGVANEPQRLTEAVNTVLQGSPIMISTIGFCIATTHSLNQPGRTMYKAADNPVALRQGLQEVLAESESFDVIDF